MLLHTYVASFVVLLLEYPQKIGIVMLDRVNESATKDDLIIRCLKIYVRRLITGFVCGCTVLLGEPTLVQDGARICPVYISEFIVTVNMMIAIVVALAVQVISRHARMPWSCSKAVYKPV
jgi:hypothetical protein